MCADRVGLPNGGYLVIEHTEALVSIDVNGGHGMFGKGSSQEKAILDVNLSAAKQVCIEHELFFWVCLSAFAVVQFQNEEKANNDFIQLGVSFSWTRFLEVV